MSVRIPSILSCILYHLNFHSITSHKTKYIIPPEKIRPDRILAHLGQFGRWLAMAPTPVNLSPHLA